MKNLILIAALLLSPASFAGEIHCQANFVEPETPYTADLSANRQVVAQLDSSRYNSSGDFTEGSIALGSANLPVHVARSIGTEASPEVDLWLSPTESRLSLVFDRDLKTFRLYFWGAMSTPGLIASGSCDQVDLNF